MAITLDEQLRILRVAVEADISPPSQILVASAEENDGAPALALGLARAFAAAGRSTALLRLYADALRCACPGRRRRRTAAFGRVGRGRRP